MGRQMNDQEKEAVKKFLRSIAEQAVQAQELVDKGDADKAMGLVGDIQFDAEKAEEALMPHVSEV